MHLQRCLSWKNFLIEITGQSDILINTENYYEKENKAIKGDEGLLLKCWVSTLASYMKCCEAHIKDLGTIKH